MTRVVLVTVGLAALTVVAVAGAVAVGSTPVAPGDVLGVLAHRLTGGLAAVAPPEATVDRIVWRLRLPRAVLALAVGGGLAVIGVAMQALVRNPLAEPYLLGISSGATAGASLFYLGLMPPLVSRAVSMPVAAFAGGLATITVVVLVAQRGGRLSVARLLLAGVAMSALMASVTSFVTFASPEPNKLRAVLFWLLGSLSGTRWAEVAAPAAVAVAGAGLLTALARPLDALLLGEEAARHLGVPTEALKRLLLALAALVTGTLVATSGAIGFVGLIVPHAARFVVGVPHRRLVPVAFVAGGLFLLLADVVARTLLPAQELPVGIVTALCGVPFFLALLRQRAPS